MSNQLSTLQRDIEILKDKKAQALANKQAQENRLNELVAEMATLGVTPETIEAEIARLSAESDSSVEKLAEMIANIKAGNYQAVILEVPQPVSQPVVSPQPVVQPAQKVVMSGTGASPSTSFMDDLFNL